MSSHVVSSFEDLQALLGKELGPGTWSEISAEQAHTFRTVCDSGPFKCAAERNQISATCPTFASGSLLLSLLGRLRGSIDGLQFNYPSKMNIFYGFDTVRFFEPVRVPARVRLHLMIVDAKMLDGAVIHAVYGHRLETSHGHIALAAHTINRIHLSEQTFKERDVY